MISKKMTDALNAQINREVYSSYLYLAMGAYCRRQNLGGFAGWMEVQSREEYEHAMKIKGYIEDQGAAVKLAAVDAPPSEYGAVSKIFGQVLEHEQEVTRHICDLMALAQKESDYATQGLLQWFVKEQVEEEATASAIVAKLGMIGQDMRGLFMVDREMAMRAKG